MYSTIMNIYVVVTFLYPKTKEKKLASYGTVIRNLCSESQNKISDDLKY